MKRHERIESDALDWLVRRDGSDWTSDEQAELDEWLEESMAHKAAYWRAEHGWRQCDRMRALGVNKNDHVGGFPWKIRWRQPAAVAASLVAIIAVGGLSLFAIPVGERSSGNPEAAVARLSEVTIPAGKHAVKVPQVRYQTPIGERLTINLVDGSTVELNTHSVLRAAISADTREVWLDSGEAFFDIAHRDGAPLVVHAGRKEVTVLGTKFSVRHDANGRVEVNVLEGLVRIDDIDAVGGRGATIGAGDAAISLSKSTLVSRNSVERVEAALAWRQDMLRFDQTPLSEVVAEFNRYNKVRLVVTDPETAQIPIGGSFHISNGDAFVRLLSEAYGLKIERNDTSVQISPP